MTTYVRTSYVPEDCDYITVNKLYKIVNGDGQEGGYTIFDNGLRGYIYFKSSAHLNNNYWEVIEMNDDNVPQIGDECEFSDDICFKDDPWKGTLKATTSDNRFISHADIVWKYCRKVKEKKTIKVVKKASEIIKWCEDHGYKFNDSGMMSPDFLNLPDLFWIKLEFCGKKPSESYTYHEDWLEEKVID